MTNQPPFILSLHICDQVIRDQLTGKVSIIGCFENIPAHKFPAMHPLMAAVAELTDARSSFPVTLLLVHDDESLPPLAKAELEIESSDPLAVHTIMIQIPQVVFPEPGTYRVQLFSSSTFLLERRLNLFLIQPPEATNEPE